MKFATSIACVILLCGLGYSEAGSVKITNNAFNPIHFNCYAWLPGNNNKQQLLQGDIPSGTKTVPWKDNKELIRCDITMPKDSSKSANIQVFDSRKNGNGARITDITVEQNKINTTNRGKKGSTMW